MQIKNSNNLLVCDMLGCHNMADIDILTDDNHVSIRLCNQCAKSLNKSLIKHYGKVVDGKKGGCSGGEKG